MFATRHRLSLKLKCLLITTILFVTILSIRLFANPMFNTIPTQTIIEENRENRFPLIRSKEKISNDKSAENQNIESK